MLGGVWWGSMVESMVGKYGRELWWGNKVVKKNVVVRLSALVQIFSVSCTRFFLLLLNQNN